MESSGALSRPSQYRSDKLKLEQQYPHSSPLQSTYGVPMPLNLNCKVFLSHSGCDKEFVRFLYAELCRRYRDKSVGFYDEETLPIAEAISMKNILEEARRSHLGVLVLTEDFFVQTPNPMLELEAFTSGKVKLLPLFFGMSVEEFKKKSQSRSWEDQWRKWSTKQLGGRSNVEEVMESWRHSLDHVTTFSGLERKKATSNLEYIQKIVDEVTKVIPPTILRSEKGVCGKNRLCQMVNNMYEKCAAKHTSFIDRTPTEVASTSTSSSLKGEDRGYTILDLVGIYGFSGLGKTTICKCLCDFYFAEFNGRVYYIDVGSRVGLGADQVSSQKHLVLSRLSTSNNNDFLCSKVYEQGEVLFGEQYSSMKDPIFLAIDNILPNKKSQEDASFYLRSKFPKGSKILITSKSEGILTNLASLHSCRFSIAIEYMPALILEEARDIFVHEFPDLHKHGFSNLEDDVNKCVQMCTIHGHCYHPLMLKSLAASLQWDRSLSNADWKERLTKLPLEGIVDKESAWENVFNVFDRAYALLGEETKRVFLDLALFYNATFKEFTKEFKMFECIRMLHPHLRNEKITKIISQLQDLCFLEETGCGQVILDLLVDFSKYKAGQGVFPEYLVRDSVNWLADLPRSARTVSFSGCGQHAMTNASRLLDLRDVEGVRVLHIVDNPGLQEVWVSGITCARLRSLIVRVPVGTSLVFCTWEQDWSCDLSAHETTGEGLRWVEIEGDVCFRSSRLSERRSLMSALSNAFFSSLRNLEITWARDAKDLVSVLGGLRNLEVLRLSHLPSVRSIDLTTCANLKELDLIEMPRLELISGFENSNLHSVLIKACQKMSVLTIPADSQTTFKIWRCNSVKRVYFAVKSSCGAAAQYSSCSGSPGCLDMFECPAVTNLDGLSQYTGSFKYSANGRPKRYGWLYRGVTLGDHLLIMKAGVDYSLCKAEVEALRLTGCNQGLAGAEWIALKNAQHIGFFITALFKAQPKRLEGLRIRCKDGGDCGCDQNAPLFGPLPIPNFDKIKDIGGPSLQYHCSQVKDLVSLTQWHVLETLNILRGCKSVELWPDFATMTSLGRLDLSFTSLKEWPAGVQHLPHLEWLDMRGCEQLPTEELMKVVTFGLPPATPEIATCIICSLVDLKDDLLKGRRRDRCSVADALDGVYLELVALFDRSSWSLPEDVVVLQLVVAIMYEVWPFGEAEIAQELHIRTKMKRLLSSECFLSLPFRVCDESLLPPCSSWEACLASESHLPGPSFSPRKLYDVESVVKDQAMRGMRLKGIALGGEGGVAACLNARPPNYHLRDMINDFLISFTQLETPFSEIWGALHIRDMEYDAFVDNFDRFEFVKLSKEQLRVLQKRVGEAVSRVAMDVQSIVATELGEDVVHTIMLAQGLDADSLNFQLDEAASSNYCTDEANSSGDDYSSDEAD